jgi:hypothetical protein
MCFVCKILYLPFFSVLAEKHGTCSSPVVHDEYSYFSTTLNVYFKYNVTVSGQEFCDD